MCVYIHVHVVYVCVSVCMCVYRWPINYTTLDPQRCIMYKNALQISLACKVYTGHDPVHLLLTYTYMYMYIYLCKRTMCMSKKKNICIVLYVCGHEVYFNLLHTTCTYTHIYRYILLQPQLTHTHTHIEMPPPPPPPPLSLPSNFYHYHSQCLSGYTTTQGIHKCARTHTHTHTHTNHYTLEIYGH